MLVQLFLALLFLVAGACADGEGALMSDIAAQIGRLDAGVSEMMGALQDVREELHDSAVNMTRALEERLGEILDLMLDEVDVAKANVVEAAEKMGTVMLGAAIGSIVGIVLMVLFAALVKRCCRPSKGSLNKQQ